jgi:type 1 fimbria pilin
MRTRNRWMIGALIALAASGAVAADGHIEFSGAVVEPTCSVDTAVIAVDRNAADAAAIHQVCGRTATAAGVSYSSRTVSVDAAAVANDRLLAYFAGNQDNPSRAQLVVRTYE